MVSKMGFYHKFSMFILFFFIVALCCCGFSVVMNIKNASGYSDCKLTAQGTLGSCVTQKENGKEYFFGVYTFVYNGQTWHFMNSTYYSAENKVPKTVTIAHNSFTNAKDMKARVKYDRAFSLPFIYGAIALVLFLLYIIFWGNYKDARTIAVAKANANKGNDAELDVILSEESSEENNKDIDNDTLDM